MFLDSFVDELVKVGSRNAMRSLLGRQRRARGRLQEAAKVIDAAKAPEAKAEQLAKVVSPDHRKVARLLAPRSRPDRLFERMTAAGALGSTAMFGAQKAKAGMTADPWDGPQGSVGQAAAKGAGGGALAATLIALLGRLGQRGRKP